MVSQHSQEIAREEAYQESSSYGRSPGLSLKTTNDPKQYKANSCFFAVQYLDAGGVVLLRSSRGACRSCSSMDLRPAQSNEPGGRSERRRADARACHMERSLVEKYEK